MWLLITVTKNPLRFFLPLWELCVNWKVWWIYCYITLKKPRVKCSTFTLYENPYVNIYFISLDFIRVTHLINKSNKCSWGSEGALWSELRDEMSVWKNKRLRDEGVYGLMSDNNYSNSSWLLQSRNREMMKESLDSPHTSLWKVLQTLWSTKNGVWEQLFPP